MNLEPGAKLGPYTIEDEIGRGGFATVYRANDPRFGGSVAIKVLAPHLASDPEAVERFVGEARALRSVHNDSVVSVFDIAGTDANPYMVLQYADRGTLLDRMIAGRPATDGEVERMVAFFARALGALHGQTLVHRDIKPSNVLIMSDTANPVRPANAGAVLKVDDRLILGDLGLVKDLSSSPRVTRGSGSAAYAAPEQRAIVSRVDPRTDIYAASAVIAEAAAGRFREADESWEQLLGELSGGGRGQLASALLLGLADDPATRPETIEAWAAEVESTLGQADVLTEPAVFAPPTVLTPLPARERSIGQRMLVPLAAIAAAVVLAAGAYGLTRTGDTTAAAGANGDRTEAADGFSTPDELLAEVETQPLPPVTGCDNADRGVAEGLAPAGLTVVDATDTTATIEWTSVGEPYSIFVNSEYFDNASRSANRYVVERLIPNTIHDIVMTAHDAGRDNGALVCARTESIAAIDRLPVGPVMASNLTATEITATSITLMWDSAASGGRYTLYRGTLAAGKSFPDIVGEGGAAPSERSYTFTDFEPGTEVVVGMRTILGENQSGLAWILVQLPDQ